MRLQHLAAGFYTRQRRRHAGRRESHRSRPLDISPRWSSHARGREGGKGNPDLLFCHLLREIDAKRVLLIHFLSSEVPIPALIKEVIVLNARFLYPESQSKAKSNGLKTMARSSEGLN